VKLRTYILFVLVFSAVFYVVTVTSPGFGGGVGWYSWSTYGYPEAWLHVSKKDTTLWNDGKVIAGCLSIKDIQIEWWHCMVSAAISTSITTVLLMPLFIYDWRKTKRHGLKPTLL
jgi:hypothetical protein